MSRPPFKWTAEWSGIILSDDNLLLPNTWKIVLEYDAISDNLLHRDIAMQRLEFMIEEKFNTSVWTNFDNPWIALLYEKMDTFLITIPSDPYDSLIAAATMLKAQSITEGVLDIQACSITSKLGYNVENIIEYTEAEEMGASVDNKHFGNGPWFMRQDAGFTDLLVMDDDQAILIKDSEEWSAHDLNWDFYDKTENTLSPVTSFIHNNQQERWIPLVIKGGKPGPGPGENKTNNDD